MRHQTVPETCLTAWPASVRGAVGTISGADWSKALLQARERLKTDHSATFEAVVRDMASAVDVYRADGAPQRAARLPQAYAAPRLVHLLAFFLGAARGSPRSALSADVGTAVRVRRARGSVRR